MWKSLEVPIVLNVVEFKTDVFSSYSAQTFRCQAKVWHCETGILPSLVIPDIPSLIVTALVVLRVLSPVIVLNLSLMKCPHISTLDSSGSYLPSGGSIAASFTEVVDSASELLIMFTESFKT